jgi:hypothetical protein
MTQKVQRHKKKLCHKRRLFGIAPGSSAAHATSGSPMKKKKKKSSVDLGSNNWASALGILPKVAVAESRLLLVREAIVALFAPGQRRPEDNADTCTRAELMQQLSALVSQRGALAFSEEELEAALHQLDSDINENCVMYRPSEDQIILI